MPTVRQVAESNEVSAGRDVTTPAILKKARKPLRLVNPSMSAIEYIVETALPGEVIHVTEEEYYNPHLWRCYEDVEALR